MFNSIVFSLFKNFYEETGLFKFKNQNGAHIMKKFEKKFYNDLNKKLRIKVYIPYYFII